jgi:hypothetical protein
VREPQVGAHHGVEAPARRERTLLQLLLRHADEGRDVFTVGGQRSRQLLTSRRQLAAQRRTPRLAFLARAVGTRGFAQRGAVGASSGAVVKRVTRGFRMNLTSQPRSAASVHTSLNLGVHADPVIQLL